MQCLGAHILSEESVYCECGLHALRYTFHDLWHPTAADVMGLLEAMHFELSASHDSNLT
jgi:hypothetical protein